MVNLSYLHGVFKKTTGGPVRVRVMFRVRVGVAGEADGAADRASGLFR